MSTGVKNHDQIFAQPFPYFLELLETDTQAAAEEFTKCARPWLLSHPTPGMRDLSIEDQQAIVDETIERCLRKDGEPLRGYTDVWGTFGGWLINVAERTCESRCGNKVPKSAVKTVRTVLFMDEEIATPKAKGRRKPPQKKTPRGKSVRRTPPLLENPSRAVHAFLGWLRTPRIFVPILIVVVAVAALRGARPGSERSTASYTPVPIDAVLMGDVEMRRSSFDVLPIPPLPTVEAAGTEVPVTAVFRQSRLIVLQLDVASISDGTTLATVEIRNKSGEVVWSDLVDADSFSGILSLRINPNTFPPGDYELLLTDTGAVVVARSKFLIR